MKNKLYIKLIFMIILPALMYYVCYINGLNGQICTYVAITCWAIYLWTTSLISTTMVGIFLPVAYLLSGIAGAKVVFAPWSSTVPWLCLSGILIGQMLLKSGLVVRLAYKCILLSGDSFNKVLLGLMLAGFVVAPLIPTALGKMAIFCALGVGICEAMKLDKDSKESAAVMLTCLFAVSAPAYCYLTGCIQIPAAMQLMTDVSGISVSWFDYAYHNFLPASIYGIVCFSVLLLVLRPRKFSGTKELINKKYQDLGKMSLAEKKAVCIILLTLLFLMTDLLHKINPAWGMAFIALLLFVPGIDLLEEKDFSKTNFTTLFFIAGAMSIGSVATEIGMAKKIAETVASLLIIDIPVTHLIVSYFLGMFTLLFLTPMTGMVTMCVPISELAMQIGMDPRVIIYSFAYGMEQYFFPYQYAVVLFLYSFKRIKLKYLLQVLSVKVIVATIVVFPLAMLYWHIVGLW